MEPLASLDCVLVNDRPSLRIRSIKSRVEIRRYQILEYFPLNDTLLTASHGTKLDDTRRKLPDLSRIEGLGWKARTKLHEGLTEAYGEYPVRYVVTGTRHLNQTTTSSSSDLVVDQSCHPRV